VATISPCFFHTRRCVRFGSNCSTGTRTGTQARQPSQYGRYVKTPERRKPALTRSV
jgi:hypothetical protein